MKKNFWLALIGIGIGGIGFGLITPVSVLLLEQNSAPSWIIGSTTTAGCLGIILFSSYAGKYINKSGVKKLLMVGLLLWMLGAIGHILWFIYPILYPVKFIMGIGGTFIFVATEVTINYYSIESTRGKNIGLYVFLLSLGIAVGTLLIWTLKFGDWVPFVIGSSIMLLVFVFHFILFEDFNVSAGEKSGEQFPISKMPLISLISAVVYGFFETSVIVVIPLYGLRNNFTSGEVSFFLASFVMGGLILTYFISRVSDKISRDLLLLILCIAMAGLFILPVTTLNLWFLLLIFFVIGGLIPSFYTVGLAYTIERIDKKDMARANGHYITMYGIGTLLGPIMGSSSVEINKQFGFWLLASLICLSTVIIFLKLKRQSTNNFL